MSNSSLVSYTRISPNRTSPRKYPIDTITIHCIVGQWTAKQGCDYFANSSVEASANYIVGKDGSIGLCVEEKDRAWTSGGSQKVNGISGSENDHRAVTLEVASDITHPYKITDAAYSAVVNLVTDICKRNGIKKLLWKGNKNLVGKVDQQNMTVHRWFANKACPGDYLYNLHGQIAEDVNKKLGTTVPKEPVKVTVDTSKNNSSEKLIYEWLKNNTDFNTAAICGILANLSAESGFKSNNLQGSYERSLGYTDDSYTNAVDNGSYSNFVRDAAGYGLVQWTFWSRKQGLLDYAKSKGVSIGNYEMQLEYMLKELQSYKSVWNKLTKCPDDESGAYDCAYRYCYDFEAPASKATASKTRGNSAKEYFLKYRKADIEESTPANVEAIYDSIDVGDILEFTGTKQYTTAGSTIGKFAKKCKVKVTKKYLESSRHPIHVRSIDDNGNFTSEVYGWVDINDLSMISTIPYLIRVTADALNYRRGPSTSYPVLGVIRDKGIYTIVQEKDGWGQLKSKVGWISLAYTEKI